MSRIATLATVVCAATGLSLTPDNWDEKTAGKVAFVKFFAPWCGHCKKMAPDWDKLMKEYEDHATIAIHEVDCTTAGKPLCDSNGVKGFPTLKHGDPNNFEDYDGGRDYAAFSAFAKTLKPLCSPSNMDLCDDEGKAQIAKVQALSDDELKAEIAAAEKKAEDAEATFKTELDTLQKTYKQLQDDKDATLAEVKASGVGLKKAVLAARSAPAADDKEEL